MPSEQPFRFLSHHPARPMSPLLHEPAEVLDAIFASHPVHRDQHVIFVLSSILDALPNMLHDAACRHHVRCRDGACNISLAGADTAHAALQMLRCLPHVRALQLSRAEKLTMGQGKQLAPLLAAMTSVTALDVSAEPISRVNAWCRVSGPKPGRYGARKRLAASDGEGQ